MIYQRFNGNKTSLNTQNRDPLDYKEINFKIMRTFFSIAVISAVATAQYNQNAYQYQSYPQQAPQKMQMPTNVSQQMPVSGY